MQILADQLAVAIINAELFQETQDHLAQHRLLHHVTSASASSTTLEEALVSTVQGLRATLDGDLVSIYLADNEGQTLKLYTAAGKPLDNQDEPAIEIGQGLIGSVAAQRQPIRIDDFHADTRFPFNGTDTRSSLALPLMYRKELLGVLQVESPLESAYNENDQEMLGTLCGTLAAIIANTRLIERQRLLFEVTSKIRRSISVQNILETTVTELSHIVGAKRASIRVGGNEEGHVQKTNGGPSEDQIQTGGEIIHGGEEKVP
jgi:GAF domain-containing protein